MKYFSLLLGVMWTVLVHAQLPEVMYYQFNENSSTTTNFASSPVGTNPVNIPGSLSTAPGGFLTSHALKGTGTVSGINVLYNGWPTDITGSFTLAFWVRDVPMSNTLYYIFGDAGAGEFRCFTNGVAGNGNWIVRGGGLPDLLVTGAAGASSNMVHVVYDEVAATYTSYVDGVQNTQVIVDSVPNHTGSGFTLGGYANNTGLNGLLDEFRWYSRALTPTEITNTYNIDLNIAGNCNPFSHFTVDSITATSAKATWNPGMGNQAYFLIYGPEGFNSGTGTKISGSYPASPPEVLLSGLVPHTTYEVHFGENCNVMDSAYLPNPYKFTTERLCASPTALASGNIGNHTAEILWNETDTAMEYYLIYNYPGFNPRYGGNTDTAIAIPHTLSALSPASSYDVYLVANCGGSNGLSDTIGPLRITTQCAPVNLFPFSENFENTTTDSPGIFPNCWQTSAPGDLKWLVNTGPTPSANTGPAADHSTGNASGKYVYLETSANAATAEVYTPEFDLSALTAPTLSFWYHLYGASMGSLQLQVSTDSTNWTTIFQLSGQQQISSAEHWQQAVVDVSQFKTTKTIFRFIGNRGGSFTGDMAIDDFEIKEGPSCPQPALFFTSVTDSSATFRIIGGGSSYAVEWGLPGFAPGSGCTGNFSGGLFTISNDTDPGCAVFSGNTSYEVYIRNECGTEGTSAWVGPLKFTTGCSGFTAPYANNFNSEASNTLPSCWSSVMAGASAGNGDAEVYNYNQPFSGVYHTRLYNGSGDSPADTALLIAPQFYDLIDGDKQIRFMAKASVTGTRLIIGSMTDPADAATFSAIDTIILGTAHTPYLIGLDGSSTYNTTDTYIAFLHGNDNAFSTIYLDDFFYETVPACAAPFITSLTVSGVTFNSARASWEQDSARIQTYLEWGLPGFTPGNNAIAAASVSGNTDTYSIDGLSPGTTYEFYLRDSCASGDLSSWVGPVSFTTSCSPRFAPFTEDFDSPTNWVSGIGSSSGDSIDACWYRFPESNLDYKWGVFNGQTSSLSTGPHTDVSANGNFIYTEASEGEKGDTAILYTPWVDVSALQNPYLSFFYHRYGSDIPELRVEARDLDSGWHSILSLRDPDQASESEAFKEIGTYLLSMGDTLRVRFVAVSEGCCAGDMAIDEVSFIEAPTCPNIANSSVSNISDTSAFLQWDSLSTATSYELWIGKAGLPGSDTYVLTDTEFLIDTLSAQTCYDFTVRAICAPGDTGTWSNPVSFCTSCSAVEAPYAESFDQLPVSLSGDLGNCWYTADSSLARYSFRTHSGTTLSSNTGPQADANTGSGVYIYTEASNGDPEDEAVIYSPLVDLSSLSQPELRFAYHMYGVDIDTLHVDVYDGANWHKDEIVIAGQQQGFSADPWRDTLVELSPFGNLVQVRFRTSRGVGFRGDLALDHILFADPVTCPTPGNITASNATATTVDLQWNGGATGNYELLYGTALSAPGGGTSLLVNASNSERLTGLTTGVQYGVFVRKICGPGDTSQWSGPYFFYTSCSNTISAPYYTNFEQISIGHDSIYENCWTTAGASGLRWESETATGTNQNTVSTGPHYDNTLYPGPNGTYMFLESSFSGVSAELLSPVIDVSGLAVPELVYHFHMYGADINKLEVYLEDAHTASRYLVDSIVGQRQVTGSQAFWQRRVDVSSVPVNTYKLVFVGYRGNHYKGDIAIDDVWIDEAGTNLCPVPDSLSMIAKGCDSIQVNWESTTSSSIIEYGKAGFVPGTGNYIYQVNGTQTISGLSPNTSYDIYIADLCGPDTSAYESLKNVTTEAAPLPIAIIAHSDSTSRAKGLKYFNFDATHSRNATSYYWDFGNGITSDEPFVVAPYVFNGNYTVTLIVTNGCGSDTATTVVNVSISVEETALGRSLKVYPNPAATDVNISFETQNEGKATLRILDITGKEVMKIKEDNINGIYDEKMDISRLSEGVYLLEVSDGSFTATRKLIKAK